MNLNRVFISTNQYLIRLFCIASISLTLGGCAAVASVPIPLRIASNIHSGYSLYKNLDNDPENDSWYVSYIKSFFAKDKEDEPIYEIDNKDEVIALNSEPIPEIKL